MMKKTISFQSALKKGAPAAFTTLIKPVGSVCNLACEYCYYLDKELLYASPAKRMSDELLESYIQNYIDGNQVDVVNFCWHGGEPLIAGLDFYERAVELQKKHAGSKRIENTLQTNGVLITDAWAQFFARENFLIGVSIDGPKDIHDSMRRNTAGEPTFDKVLAGIEKLQRAGAEYNTLSAVGAASAKRGLEIYKFLKSIGSRYMQFLPVSEKVVESENYSRPIITTPDNEDANLAPWSITARDYGYFLTDIFDYWVQRDVGQYYVQMFDATLARWCGMPAGVCSMNPTCGDGLCVEHNGDVYSCDHFVYPQYKLGNIKEDDLRTMFRSKFQFEFGVSKRSSLPEKCTKCRWLDLCNGECPKHRFSDSVNSLCSGLQHFFRHSASAMEYMRDCLEKGLPPSNIMFR